DFIYIGSTTNFSARKSSHKKNTNNKVSKKYNYPLYQYIRGCGGFKEFNIEIVEKYPCNSKIDGLRREKELIELYNAKLNSIAPIKN
ncbi:hypothetical protein EBR96_03080, partial [bacterium]|nr:hypothetical protein [bacterium]